MLFLRTYLPFYLKLYPLIARGGPETRAHVTADMSSVFPSADKFFTTDRAIIS